LLNLNPYPQYIRLLTKLTFSIALLLVSLALHAQIPAVVVSSYFNPPNVPNATQSDEWTELFVVNDDVDMRNWTLGDNNATQTLWSTPITFNNIPFWNHVRAGTIIMIWHRGLNSANVPHVTDANADDGYLELSATDAAYFNGGNFGGNTLNIAAGGDLIRIQDGAGNDVHALGHIPSPPAGGSFQLLTCPALNHAAAFGAGATWLYVTPGNTALSWGNPKASGTTYTSLSTSGANATFGLPNTNATNLNCIFWQSRRQPAWVAPTATAVSQLANTQVLLTWSAAIPDTYPTDNTTGYMIVRSNSGVFGVPVDGHTYIVGNVVSSTDTVIAHVTPSSTPSYTDNYSVPCNSTVFYRIYAYRYTTDNSGTNDLNAARGRAYNEAGAPATLISALPAAQTMTGNTSYCAGSNTTLGLTNSETGVNYQLYSDCPVANTPVGAPVAGSTGNPITFPPVTITGAGPCNFIVLGSYVAFPNCTTATNTILVTELPTPTFTAATTNPTTCGGNDGIITLTGLTASTSYTVNYTNSVGTAIGPLNLISDPAGNLVLTGSLFPAGNYSAITVTLAGCISAAGTAILVDPLPVAPTGITTPQTTICGDGLSTITLTANGGSGTTIEWFAGSCSSAVIGTGAIFIVNPSPTITTTYFARWTSACGISLCTQITITVEAPPTIANAGPNQSLCGTLTASLAGNAPTVGTGVWSVSSATGTVTFANTALNTTGITVSVIGTYVLQWTISPAAGGLCLPTSSLITIIFDNALTVNAASNTPVCSGTDILLTSDIAGATYAWTGPNGFTSTDQNPIVVGATTVATGTYSVTVTNIPGGCPQTTNTTDVVVEQSAIPATSAASTPGSVCADDAGFITLSVPDGNGDVLNWYEGSCSGTVIGTGINLPIPSPTVTTTYFAGWTTANCGTAACAQVIVTVTDPPTIADAGVDNGYCGILTATLGGNDPIVGTGVWTQISGAGTISFADATLFNTTITATVMDVYVLRWTISNGADCPASFADVTITFSNSLQVTADYNSPVCEGGMLTLTSSIAGATYAWTGPNGFSSTSQNPLVTNNATPLENGTYHVDVTNIPGGCPPTSDDIVVALVAVPVTPAISSTGIIGNGQAVCNGTNLTYSIATPTAGSSYAWTLSGGGTITPNANQASVIWSTVGGPYTLRVTETSAAGCPGTPVSLGVTVNAASAPAILVTALDNPACSGAIVNFNAVPTNGGASPGYQWKKNGTDITGETNSTLSTSTLVNGDIISCVLTSSLTCAIPVSDEGTVNMIINPLLTPAVSIVANNNPTCPGGTVEFTATPANEGTTPAYQWELNGTPVGGNTATYSSNTFVQDDEIVCRLTSSELCADPPIVPSGIITIDVGAGLAISIAPGDTLCSGFSYVLDPGAGYVSYTWFDGRIDQSITASEVGSYSVIVTDQYGCKGADSVYLKACADEFTIPTAFTPNHDGLNDVFRPVWKADVIPTSFLMLIYNQWGTLVYSGTDVFAGWDGTSNGNLCPVGVYTYFLKVEKPAGKSPAQQTTLRGIVTLVR
jgi:gliding motility-associated-like protein